MDAIFQILQAQQEKKHPNYLHPFCEIFSVILCGGNYIHSSFGQIYLKLSYQNETRKQAQQSTLRFTKVSNLYLV